MAETAVGLFDRSDTAEAVVEALRANGLPSNKIRVIARPAAMPVENAMSTPSIDFAASLARDLRAMGATEEECKIYLDGVQRGNVLVFASGTRAQADTAVGVMNAYDSIEIEEFAGAASSLPSVHASEAGTHEAIGLKSEPSRARSEGARIFSW